VRFIDREETVMLVMGSAVVAQERDRPIAILLKREIDSRGDRHHYRRALLVGDAQYLDSPELHRHPTIAIGGPGVNAVVQQYAPELPTVWQVEERAFVQVEIEDGKEKRVALWGMDAGGTAQAVDAFIAQGFLDALLQRIWVIRPELET
jgi:hypothetical protein